MKRPVAVFATAALVVGVACAVCVGRAGAGGLPVSRDTTHAPGRAWIIDGGTHLVFPKKGTSGAPARSIPATAGSRRFDFARDIGLVEGDRKDSLWLMIADATLAIGDSLTLISDEPNPDADTYVTIVGAAVKERLASLPAALYAKAVPESADVFYRLATPAGALDCCIFGYAVRAPRAVVTRVAGQGQGDLDGDGTAEIFQSCGSGEFLNPTVWSGRAFTGARRWTRAYNLGYPVESNCPDSFKPPASK